MTMLVQKRLKFEIFSYRLASLIMLASEMIGRGICQMDDSGLLVLSRKVRYALFPDSSTMGVCTILCDGPWYVTKFRVT
jgi:hypothetical protein